MKHKHAIALIGLTCNSKTSRWLDLNKIDFSKCQRCPKRKSPIYDKRYKASISCICKNV